MFKIEQAGIFEDIRETITGFPAAEEWVSKPYNFSTELRKSGNNLWLSSYDFGAIEINCEAFSISTYPLRDSDFYRFHNFVNHVWLPLAYHACKFQVIHASSNINLDTQQIIGFCGPSGSGKSTFAFGLAKKKNWSQVTDDRFAFAVENSKVKPIHIPDHINLRPASVTHFKESGGKKISSNGFGSNTKLSSIFYLTPIYNKGEIRSSGFEFQSMSKADAYDLLIKQAFAITTKFPDLNRDLIFRYLTLTEQINTYNLIYYKSFEMLDDIYEAIEDLVI